MRSRGIALAAVGAALFVFAADPGACAEKEPGPTSRKGPSAAASSPAIPDGYKLNILIRTTLIALNQANQTGNYSVLRDLGTPQFQAMNTDTRLGEIFAALRSRNLDLSPVVFFDPKLVREPMLQAGGLLRLTGFVPTEPQRILFDMGFERIGDQWRVSAIVIDVQPAPAAASAATSNQAKSVTKTGALPARQPVSKPAP